MACLTRVIGLEIAQHVAQRGNWRQELFFSDDNYAAYRDLVAEPVSKNGRLQI